MAITINGSGTITGVSAGGLPDGCVDADTLSTTLDLSGNTVTLPAGTGGKVLQVVQGSMNTTNFSTTSTSYVAGNSTVSITPSSTSSKILIIATGAWYKDNAYTHSNYNEGYYRLYRGSTSTMIGNEMRIGISMYDQQSSLGAGLGRLKGHLSLDYLDSPSTTSSVTYGIGVKRPDSENGNCQLNDDHLIAIEIGG